MERFVEVAPGVRLWTEEHGDPGASPLLLVMGANASGLTWPDTLVERLTQRHRVIRYDHRDTGRSTRVFDEMPYALRDLATDAVAVLDAYGIGRAHVMGMSLGGTLVQLLLLDHPDRLLSATVFATSALGSGLADVAGESDLPGPDPKLLALWEQLADERDREAELDWRVEHWRVLNGDAIPYDAQEFRDLERRIVEHAGDHRNPAAHAMADQGGLDRGAELAGNTVPVLVLDAPEDPVNRPPHAEHLAAVIGASHRVVVPGMGHALPAAVVEPVAAAVLEHTAAADAVVS